MIKSNYTYALRDHSGRTILLIEDQNLGGKSVTNDIENVVQDIERCEGINPSRTMIVYKDSEGVWDGWDHVKQSFVPLNEDTWSKAVDVYINLQLHGKKEVVS